MKKLYTLAMLLFASLSVSAQVSYPNFENGKAGYEYLEGDGESRYSGKNGANCMNIDDAYYIYSDANTQGDAWDGAFHLGLSFYDAVNDVVLDTGYTNNEYSGSYVQTGNNFQYGTEKIGDFHVSTGYYFKPNSRIITVVYKIANNNATAKNAAVKVYTEFGSDGDSFLDSSSTGEVQTSSPMARVSSMDMSRWRITSEENSNDDPTNTMVRQGASTSASMAYTLITPGYGSDEQEDSFNVAIPANSYRYIVFVNRLDSTAAAAKNAIKAADINEAYVINNMLLGSLVPTSDYAKVANWDFASYVTSVNDVTDISNTVNTFPNPTNGELNLNINNDVTGTLFINVIDNNGVVKLSTSINKNTSNMDTTIDMSALAAGLYIVEMKQEGVVARKKVSKF